MKVRQAIGVIAIASAWIAGSVYIITTFLTRQRLDVLEQLPWLVPLLNGLMFSLFGYVLYRSSRTMLRATCARHRKGTLVWLVLWGEIVCWCGRRHTPDTPISLANWLLVSGIFFLISSCILLLLDEKWHSTARLRWLFMSTLALGSTVLVVFGL